MKTIAADLKAHYASDAQTTALLWKITRKDGQVFGFTSHDVLISYGGTDYAPSSAFDASALPTNSDMSTDSLESTGLLDSEGITADDMEAGLWDGAAVELRRVNWADLTDGAEVLRIGELGEVQRSGGMYRAEIRGLMYPLQNNIGRSINPTCDAALGDARCGVDLDALKVSSAITTATSRRAFTASGLAQAAAYFTAGEVVFTSGANDGLAMEVKDHDTGGVLALQLALPYDLQVGDTFDIVPGCDKTKPTCKAKFNNVPNFRGFSFVPGPDRVLTIGGS